MAALGKPCQRQVSHDDTNSQRYIRQPIASVMEVADAVQMGQFQPALLHSPDTSLILTAVEHQQISCTISAEQYLLCVRRYNPTIPLEHPTKFKPAETVPLPY